MNAPTFSGLAAAILLALPAAAAPGNPDAGFGTAGVSTNDLGVGDDVAYALALQGDGKVLLAGDSVSDNFTLLRLNANGTVDTDFGSGGTFVHTFGSFESARGVAVQSTGRIVMGGAGLVGGVSRDFAVVRCSEEGTLDTSFGTGGRTTTDISGGFNDQVFAIARHTDDTILLAGSHRSNFAMVRYLAGGGLDGGFGTGGKVFSSTVAATDEQINAVTVMSDGRIVVAGQSRTGNNTDVAVARYLSNGTPDGSFGSGGKTVTPVGAGNVTDVANGVAVLADGKVLIAGTSGGDFLLLRYTSGGLTDSDFGTGAGAIIGFDGGTENGTGIVVQSDGSIILTGTSTIGGRDYFAAVRFDPDGELDTAFGTGGGILTTLTAGSDTARAAVLQNDGKLLIAGSAGATGNKAFAAVRYETAGLQTLAQWRQQFFGTTDNSGNAANHFDADTDGLVNLLEYAFGQNPTLGSSRTVPDGRVIGGNFVTTFTAPATVTGITYSAEWTTTLAAGSWEPVNDTGTGSVHTFTVPLAGRPDLHLRWHITAP